MARAEPPTELFVTDVFGEEADTGDKLPASFHHHHEFRGKRLRVVSDPAKDVKNFLKTELSLRRLEGMQKHLWFAGSKRGATQLHLQVAMGRQVIVADRMDLHLVWDNERVFLKPIPKFLLDPTFWKLNLKCLVTCKCQNGGNDMNNVDVRGAPPGDPRSLLADGQQPFTNHERVLTKPEQHGENQESSPCVDALRKVAFGFLYTYACLICSESDFFVANEKRLLPLNEDDATIKWESWKKLAREVIASYNPDKIHPRFLRAELRLHRLNTIHRFTRPPLSDPYLRGWRDYTSLFRENLVWISTAAVFIVLVLTAMQVGLATDQLREDANFQLASYGFTVFAILGPLCAFGAAALGALYNLVKDMPWLFGGGAVPSPVHPPSDSQLDQNTRARQETMQMMGGIANDGEMV